MNMTCNTTLWAYAPCSHPFLNHSGWLLYSGFSQAPLAWVTRYLPADKPRDASQSSLGGCSRALDSVDPLCPHFLAFRTCSPQSPWPALLYLFSQSGSSAPERNRSSPEPRLQPSPLLFPAIRRGVLSRFHLDNPQSLADDCQSYTSSRPISGCLESIPKVPQCHCIQKT